VQSNFTNQPTSLQHKAADYRRALNALRGFASIYVVFYHLRLYSNFDWFGSIPIIRFGYIGVDFFFILSGLIVSHVYLKTSRNSDVSFWQKFIWYRLARLLPVHVFIMVSMLLVASILPFFDSSRNTLTTTNLTDWVSLTFLVRQWGMPENYAWNSPAWSVSAEFFAYIIVFPIIAFLCAKRLTLNIGITLTAIGVTILGLLISMTGTVNVIPYAGPLMRVTGGFIIGSGLFIILQTAPKLKTPPRDWDGKLFISLCLLPLMFWVAMLLTSNGVTADPLLLCSFTGITVLAYLAKGKTAAFLSKPVLFWLGEISFGLYMCHIPMFRVCKYIALHFDLNLGFAFGITCVLVSILVAHLLYHYLETPMRLYMRARYLDYSRYKANKTLETPKPF